MTASVQTKGNRYYVVLRYKDTNNKWQAKWVNTSLSVDGHNKRAIERKRIEVLQEWQDKLTHGSNILFSDYLRQWLGEIKGMVADSTLRTYQKTVENSICPYFDKFKISLCDIKAYHIQDFYKSKMEEDGVSANTIHHYHANISKALSDAVRLEKIAKNPATAVQLPKIEKHTAETYTADELKALIAKTMGTDIETVVLLASWFGLRRGEIIGLKWDCIDLDNKTLSIVGVMSDKGGSGSKKDNLHYVPHPKTKSSIRSFPLDDSMVDYFRKLRQKQDIWKQARSYIHDWDEFVCVRPNGEIIPLEYITRKFPELCVECGLKRLKLHELRHTNISLLLNDPNISMKELQEWAGHSNYNTTANTYSHLQTGAKNKLTTSIQTILTTNATTN